MFYIIITSHVYSISFHFSFEMITGYSQIISSLSLLNLSCRNISRIFPSLTPRKRIPPLQFIKVLFEINIVFDFNGVNAYSFIPLNTLFLYEYFRKSDYNDWHESLSLYSKLAFYIGLNFQNSNLQ